MLNLKNIGTKVSNYLMFGPRKNYYSYMQETSQELLEQQ